MFGRNPKRAPESGNGDSLDIVEIFSTLQGEGPFAGYPSVFVRLGGCNLACAFCDTEFETFDTMSCDVILDRIRTLRAPSATTLVVITGGEPLRQPIGPLTEALIAAGYVVQIETNGTIYRALDARVHVVCSPKAIDGKYYPLRPDVLAQVDVLKFIVSATDTPYDCVPEIGQSSRPDMPVYVQPMDAYDTVINNNNLAHTLALASKHGCQISMQLHKMIGVA